MLQFNEWLMVWEFPVPVALISRMRWPIMAAATADSLTSIGDVFG
ncbi:MAG: hypothetical protein ACRDIY_08665 [Chloroflexota bacterium]